MEASKYHDIIILMTGTVNPEGMSKTHLQDPIIRKQQYIQSINFYLEETIFKIVFCENTNINFFNEIESNEKNERLEYLTFKGNNYNKKKGKGYGEAKIISYALQNSKFINKCNYIIKINGRVKILNINDYVKRHFRPNDIYVDFFSEYNKISSVCLITSKQNIYNFLKNNENIIDDEKFTFEKVLFIFLIKNSLIKIHPSIFEIDGICGSSNKFYKRIPILYHKGTNCYLLSEIYRQRKNYIYRIFNFFKYIWFRIIAKLVER